MFFQPPILVEEFNTNTMQPAIIVEGDVMLKDYDFIVEDTKDDPLKIGRVNMSIKSVLDCLSLSRLSMTCLI